MSRILMLVMAAALLLSACSGGTPGAGDPAKVVEQYLQAKVARDATTMRGLLCSSLEASLDAEAHTFDGVTGARIEGMACVRDGTSNTVRCQGKIVAAYGAENTEFPLVAYRVVQEDGAWKWCGEAP